MDKGKIWCVENCRQGEEKGKLHQVLIHYPCPMLFLNSFFPFFEDYGKLSITGSLHAPCSEKQPTETIPITGQQQSNIKQKKLQINLKLCKHEKISLLSVQATLQWIVQKLIFAIWKIGHVVWGREKVLFLDTSWLTWACTRASLKRMNQFTENLPACCSDNPRLLLSQIKRRSGFRKESYR